MKADEEERGDRGPRGRRRMREIHAADMEADVRAVLDAVADGETVVITREGRPFARLEPVRHMDPEQARKAKQAFLEWQEKNAQNRHHF